MKELRMWCYKVLPLVYDDSLSYYEVLCKLKAKINELISIIDDIPEAIKEYLNTDDFKAYIALLVDTLKSGFVSVDDYGAKGDGETDDTDAFIEASDASAELGIPLIADGEKTYLIKGGADKTIYFRENVDLNGATILVDNDSTENRYQDYIKVDQEWSTKNILGDNLTNQRTYDNDLWNKVLYIVSPLSLGTREGFDTQMYHEQLLVTDKNGWFENSNYMPTVISGTYTVAYSDPWIKPIEIKNIVFEYKDTSKVCALWVQRHNVTIKNIVVKGGNSNAESGWTPSIRLTNTYNVKLENIIGEVSNSDANTGNLISLSTTSNTIIDRYINHKPAYAIHGAFGSGYETNLTIKNSILHRFDVHYEMIGSVVIDNCVLETAYVCGGWGNVVFRDCTFIRDSVHNTGRAISRRNDVRLPFSGTIKIENCSVDNYANFIEYWLGGDALNLSNFNTSETVYIIDNITFTHMVDSFYFILANDRLDYGGISEYGGNVRFVIKNITINKTCRITGDCECKEIKIEDFNALNSAYISFNLPCKMVDIVNSNINIYFGSGNQFVGNISVVNSNILGLAKAETMTPDSDSFFKVIGCEITWDNVFGFTEYPVTVLDDNIITASTHSNESAWNTGIVRT